MEADVDENDSSRDIEDRISLLRTHPTGEVRLQVRDLASLIPFACPLAGIGLTLKTKLTKND